MKIGGDGIHFDTLSELKQFIFDFDLSGVIQLAESIEDNQGKVLIKEHIHVKESALTRLESLDGQYREQFKVSITDDLIRALRKHLTELVLQRLEERENGFLAALYAETHHNYKGYINGAFLSRSVALSALKLSRTKRQFFNHLCDLGLAALGIAIQNDFRIKFVNRYSFLAGFFADISMIKEERIWKEAIEDDSLKKKYSDLSAQTAEQLKLNQEVIEAIRHCHVEADSPPHKKGAPPLVTDQNVTSQEILSELLESDEESSSRAPLNEKAKLIVSEVMKIAKFISDIALHTSDRDHFAEELIYMLAYNMSLGYFHRDLVLPILNRFRQFETNVKRMMQIAELEQACIHPPSAWAYPKPNAAQILCRNRVFECPRLEQGWTINIIGTQEAYGWIGTVLKEGQYPKCTLEEGLVEIFNPTRPHSS